MTDLDITLYFNELRLHAVEDALADDGATLEDKLKEHFDFLYEQLVPAEQRLSIEAEIKKNEAAERAAEEARRCFGVFHIRENGEDRYFTSDVFQSLFSTAYRYRLYDRGELSAHPQAFAASFPGADHISAAEYEELCDRMPNDIRIRALVDYDLDGGTVSACESSDNAWQHYRLYDLSVAVFKAHRGGYKSSEDRERIFENALAGKEIDIESELLSETEPPTMQM